MFKILKALVVTAMLAIPVTAFASGGDTPIPGIDIIIKSLSNSAKPLSFTESELTTVNKLKGFEKPEMIAKIAERKAKMRPLITAPKGGWFTVLKDGLIEDWCVDCNGGETEIKATSQETGKAFVVLIKIKSHK